MESQLQRYARRLVEEQLGHSRLQLAQIADDISTVKTEQDTKFNDNNKLHLMRWKIRILGIHEMDVDPRALPWAYAKSMSSGLRGENLPVPMLPRGTFVYVSKDINTNEYFIDRVSPNTLRVLPGTQTVPYSAVSGFDPTNTLYPVPDSGFTNNGANGGLVPGNEEYNVSFRSYADYTQDSPRREANWQFPVIDGAKNTVGGMSSSIENAIKDIESLERTLVGSNSILRQSLESLDNAEKSIDIMAEALEKQIKQITGYITNLMTKAQKKLLRNINTAWNMKTAAVPVSGKFSNNNLINQFIKIASCAFNASLLQIPGLVQKGMLQVIKFPVNNASCLIENFTSQFIGQIVGQLSALINGAMKSISGVLGTATDFLGSIGDVLSSIMDFLECEAQPKASDPVVKEWNFLDGGSPVKITLNVSDIFKKAQKVGEEFQALTKVPEDISTFEYKIDIPSADIITEGCGNGVNEPLGPQDCGAPEVTFWGGVGSGAKGTAIVSTAGDNLGQIIAVNITDAGNYTQAPYVTFDDKCGRGRGAVGEAILGPIEVEETSRFSDFQANLIAGTNKISGLVFLPDAEIKVPSDLIGKDIMQLSNSPSIPAGTKIIDVETDANNNITAILNRRIEGDGSSASVDFHIVGDLPEQFERLTTFNVSVKKTPRSTNAFVVDNRQQRELTFERNKIYRFDQSSPSNGLVIEGGEDELVLAEGQDVFGIVDVGGYREITLHPLRFSEKSDGIHNCERASVDASEPDWLLAADGLSADDWVIAESGRQGWSPFLIKYGVYPEYKQLPGEHTGNWEIIVPKPGNYRIEVQADNWAGISWDGVYLGSTDALQYITTTNTITNVVGERILPLSFNNLHPANDPIELLNSKTLCLKDGRGTDCNASFIIETGNANFTVSGRTANIEGTGEVTLLLRWNDRPWTDGVAIDSITIGDITWTRNGRSGEQREGFRLTEEDVIENIESSSVPDLWKGPHNTPKYFDFEVFEESQLHILTVVASNVRAFEEYDPSKNWFTNPAAVGWQLTDAATGKEIANSTDPFNPRQSREFPDDPDALLTNCGEEYTFNVTKVGTPGSEGSYVEIVVNDSTPDTLYYYCENHPKMGGKINVIGAQALDQGTGCRNCTIEVTAIDENGSVTGTKILGRGTGYSLTTDILTVGGSGTSLSFNITGYDPANGEIVFAQVSNGGRDYQVGDIVIPVCNLGTKTVTKTGIGVTSVLIKETGRDYLPWPDGSLGGMNRTWADRCQTIVRRSNGIWDLPYDYTEVLTLYPGDCVTLPAQEQVCIDENFDVSLIPGSTIIGESITPRDMSDFSLTVYSDWEKTYQNTRRLRVFGTNDSDFGDFVGPLPEVVSTAENEVASLSNPYVEWFEPPTIIPIPITYNNLNEANTRITVTNNRKKILLRDGDGIDTNASFEIEEVNGGTARFTEDGRGLEVIGDYVDIQLVFWWKDDYTVAGKAVDSITIPGLNGDVTWTQTGTLTGIDRRLIFLSGSATGTYIERIDGNDPDFPAGVAQWWFYINGNLEGVFIQQNLAEVPQLVDKKDKKLIYRIGEYQEKAITQLVIDPEEWYRVKDITDPNSWVMSDPQGWSPFLKNYGVWPSKTQTLVNIPQTGTWEVKILREGNYYFQVQADNQASINFDGNYIGQTTVFKSHNKSTFLSVPNVSVGTHTIEATIINAARGNDDSYNLNPGALAWVLREGDPPPAADVETVWRTEERDVFESKHDVTYTGLNAANNPIVIQDESKTLCLKDGSGNDCNARFSIIGGTAKFINGANQIEGTGDITLRLEWNDRTTTSGVAVKNIQIGSVTWTQSGRSGVETKTVTLEGTVIGTEKLRIMSQSVPDVPGVGNIVRSSLDPFANIPDRPVESLFKSYFAIAPYEILDEIDEGEGEEIFDCAKAYANAKLLGYSDCDIRNFIESNGIKVDQCMQDKLDDPHWGNCASFSVVFTAPPCPEVEVDPCPPGQHLVNGRCVPIDDGCPPGQHKVNGVCVPIDDGCPPGQHKENGVCVPDGCPPGQHLENGVCVPDEQGCPPGYRLLEGVCVPDGNDPDCPPGQHKENGVCVPSECTLDSECPEGSICVNGRCIPITEPCPKGYYLKDGLCIPEEDNRCIPSNTRKVIMTLDEIVVANPGFGYNCCEDSVVIEPAHGAKAIIEECDGGIIRIKVTDSGSGFTQLPEVYINTTTGFNAFLMPILKTNEENLNEFPDGTNVIHVIDCPGNVDPNAKTQVT